MQRIPQICKSKDDEDNMLLCDGCDKGYRAYCVVPTIKNVPDGYWFSPKCLDNKEVGGEGGRGQEETFG